MKRWQKIDIWWSGRFNPCANIGSNSNDLHTIGFIRAVALPDRKGRIFFSVSRANYNNLSDDTCRAICARLSEALERYKEEFFQNPKDHMVFNELESGFYKIEFILANGDRFCNTAIKIVRKILETLGVEDKKGSRLADFLVSQETFIKQGDKWITFAGWLRLHNHLPPSASDEIRSIKCEKV
jgi:hypothetical protein